MLWNISLNHSVSVVRQQLNVLKLISLKCFLMYASTVLGQYPPGQYPPGTNPPTPPPPPNGQNPPVPIYPRTIYPRMISPQDKKNGQNPPAPISPRSSIPPDDVSSKTCVSNFFFVKFQCFKLHHTHITICLLIPGIFGS